MRDLPIPHIQGALVVGPSAYLLAKVLKRSEIERWLATNNVPEAYREPVMLAVEAIELEGRDWYREQQKRNDASDEDDNFRTRLPHAEARPDRGSDSQMMNVNQASSELNRTPRHVRSLLATGQLAGRKNGRDWLIDPKSVAGYKKDHRATAT